METIEISINDLKNPAIINKLADYYKTIIVCKCRICGSIHKIHVFTNDLCLWLSGKMFIQNALIELKPDERELLQSQICGTCFDKIFKDE